ncbi:MAG: T9SS type A sorting domain-containing protein [Bacteroidota bacterium]
MVRILLLFPLLALLLAAPAKAADKHLAEKNSGAKAGKSNAAGMPRQLLRTLSVCDVPGGNTLIGRFGRKTYYLSANAESYVDAFNNAQSWGGRPAVITSQALQTFIYFNLLTGVPGFTSARIGAFRNGDDQWTWESGDPVSYNHWAAGEPDMADPNKRYAVMNQNGSWAAGEGDSPLPYVFEIDDPNPIEAEMATFCSGEMFHFNSQTYPGATYQWFGPNGFGVGTSDPSGPIMATEPGQYELVVTIGSCIFRDTVTAAFFAGPEISISSGSLTICPGDTISLASSNESDNYWSTGETTQSIRVWQAGTYSVQTVVGTCTSQAAQVVVALRNPPAAPALLTSGGTFCFGANVNLNFSGEDGAEFSIDNGITWQPTGSFDYSPASPGTYTVSAMQRLGSCVSAASAAVTFTFTTPAAGPSVSVSPAGHQNETAPYIVCANSTYTVTLSGVPAGLPTKVFMDGAEAGSSTDTTYSFFAPAATPPPPPIEFTGVYIINGCPSAVSRGIIVSFNNAPQTPVISGAAVQQACGIDSVVLESSIPTNNYWSNGATTQRITVRNSGIFTLVNAIGCTSAASAPVQVILTPVLEKPVITGLIPSVFCQGSAVQLISSSATGNVWSNGDTTQTVMVTDSGKYTVKIRRGICESPASDTITLRVTPTPATPSVMAMGNTTLCTDTPDSVMLMAEGGAGTFLWSTGETGQVIYAHSSGAYSVQLAGSGCTSQPSLPVNVVLSIRPPIPTISLSRPSAVFCALPGDSIVLTSSYPTGNLWSNNDTTRSITVRASGTYTVTYLEGSCTSSSFPLDVIMNSIPPTPTITRNGDTLVVNGFGNGSFTWFLDGSPIPGNSGNTLVANNVEGSYTVSYTDVNSCSSAVSAPVIITELSRGVYVPRLGLAPNPTDNYFTIIGLISAANVEIYSNLGRLVLSTRTQPGRSIDVSSLAPGIYTVKVLGKVMRLVIQ